MGMTGHGPGHPHRDSIPCRDATPPPFFRFATPAEKYLLKDEVVDYQDIPEEIFPDQRMDMLGNEEKNFIGDGSIPDLSSNASPLPRPQARIKVYTNQATGPH
jgi:hypothetical protein